MSDIKKIEKVDIIKMFTFGYRKVAIIEVHLADGDLGLTCFYESTGHNSGMPKTWLPISGISGPEMLLINTMGTGWLIKSFLWVSKGKPVTILQNRVSYEDHKNLDKRLTFDNSPVDIGELSKMIEAAYNARHFSMPSVIDSSPTDEHAIRVLNSMLRYELNRVHHDESSESD